MSDDDYTQGRDLQGENQALIEALRDAGEVTVEAVDFDGEQAYVALARGEVLDIKEILDKWRKAPEVRRGVAHLLTVESLVAFIRDQATGFQPALFARWSPPTLEAVIDHEEAEMGLPVSPTWRRHRAVYSFPLSTEWSEWAAFASKERGQRELAVFLEEHAGDIVGAPSTESARAFATRHGLEYASSAAVMALARGLRLTISREVANEENLESGERNIVFRETHAGVGNQPLRVPRAFLLRVAPFEGGHLYEVPVRVRYRVDGGAVLWSLVIQGAERFLRDAIAEAAKRVSDEVGCPLYFGTDAGAR